MHSTQKTCRLCGRTLPVEDFYPSGSNPRTGKIYRSSRCRKCHAMKALADTTWEVFQQYGVDVEGISALDRLSREDVTSIVSLYISNYVNERLQEELFYRVEKGSLDESTANQYADQIKGFIAEVVRLDFQNIDPLRIDWQGTEGQELIERKYQEAYGLLGEAE